jgi:hypothetical protein
MAIGACPGMIPHIPFPLEGGKQKYRSFPPCRPLAAINSLIIGHLTLLIEDGAFGFELINNENC